MTQKSFPMPKAPYPNMLAFAHEHRLTLIESLVQPNPNGTFSSLWACADCPDVFVGDHIGPVPEGYCACGWVQKKWPRKRCESCKRSFSLEEEA